MKKILSIILSIAMVMSLASVSVFAVEKDGDSSKNEMDHVEDILANRVEVVNEDPDSNIGDYAAQLVLFDLDSKKMDSDVRLVDQDITIDVRRAAQSMEKEVFVATVIYENQYEMLDTIGDGIAVQASSNLRNDEVYCDVTMYVSITYDRITLSNKHYGYKVTQVKGGYVRTSDPQMTCISLKLGFKGWGDAYTSATGGRLVKSESKTGATINNPTKGSTYTLTTNSGYYYDPEIGGTYILGKINFTLKRTVSGFTYSDVMGVGYGSGWWNFI